MNHLLPSLGSIRTRSFSTGLLFAALQLAAASWALAIAGAAEPTPISLSEGKIKLQAPPAWQKREPRVNIIEYEFAAKPAEGDKEEGRLTIMGAGGSVDANIDRWLMQFAQPDGASTKERSKVEKKSIGGATVHVVDIAGSFKDSRGPFAPVVTRENYRMLGAIIVSEKLGQYFVKFTGPKATVAAHEKAFAELIESVKVSP